jgi:protein TonB
VTRSAAQRRPAARVRRWGLLGGCALAVLGAGPTPPPSRAADPAVGVAFEDALPDRPSVDARLEEIRRRLQAALVYPPIARRIGLEGTAWLRFEIDREGAARDVAVARSSGHAVLDRAARQAVGRAGRLPWVYGQIEVPIRFSLDAPRS